MARARWSGMIGGLHVMLALAMVALTVLVPASPADAQETTEELALATPDFYGLVGRDPWYEFDATTGQPKRAFQEAMLRNMAAAGVRWVRIEFHTAYTDDGVHVAGQMTYAETDAFINELAPRYGLKVLALLNTGILSDQPPFNYRVRDLAGADVAARNRYIAAFADRAREIAQRYAGRIAAYEILNEPNISAELGATTGWAQQEIPPNSFGELLAQTATAIRGVDGSASLVLGGLLKGVPIDNPGRYTTDYLHAVYSAPAVIAYRATYGRLPFDGVGLHPYPNTALARSQWLGDTLGLVEAMGAVMDQAGDPGQLWLTEIGVKATPSSQPVGPATGDESFQAGWLRDLYTALATTFAGQVARAFWFKYEDFPPPTPDQTWGLTSLALAGDEYDAGGTVRRVKPAFQALHDLAFVSASTWLFAEGFTGSGFDQYFTIQNPGATDALVAVTYLPTGAAPVVRGVVVGARSRATVLVHDLSAGVGRPWPVAARVRSSQPVVVERPMYFTYGAGWTGGHVVVGAPATSTRWYFAEGYTGSGFDQYLTIQNPHTAAANVRITYYLASGSPIVKTLTAPAHSRTTVSVHETALGVGRGKEVSTKVESTNGVGIVVERPMYFRYGNTITGGHVVVGATEPRAAWLFAEGYTGDGFDEYLTILNPNSTSAPVVITYYLGDGSTRTYSLMVRANARATIAVYDPVSGVGRGQEVSARVSTTHAGGIVVERPMYFTYGAGWTGGHNVLGAAAPRRTWDFAEGYTGSGFDQYLTLMNPNAEPAPVTLTYYLRDGSTITRQLTVPATARRTVAVHDAVLGVGRGQEVSTRVTTSHSGGIVVERPMYFTYGPGWTGGHVVVGHPSG